MPSRTLQFCSRAIYLLDALLTPSSADVGMSKHMLRHAICHQLFSGEVLHRYRIPSSFSAPKVLRYTWTCAFPLVDV